MFNPTLFIEAVLYRYRAGIPWRDLPERFGDFRGVHTRFSRWAKTRVRMGSIAENTSGRSYGYRMSKVALSMVGRSLAHDLRDRGIAVAISHPGLVQSPMTNFTASGITPEESVRGLLARIDELTLKNTGTFWHAKGEVLPWQGNSFDVKIYRIARSLC